MSAVALSSSLVLVLLGSLLALGLWLGGLRKRIWMPVACTSCILLLARLALALRQDIEYAIIPFDFYVYLQPYLHVAAGFLLFGIGYKNIPNRIRRDGVLVVAGLVYVYLWQNYGPWAYAAVERLSTQSNLEGDRLQSTAFSCAPAAAARLLAHWNVPASEKEMALLSHTTMAGTTDFGTCLALRGKLAPLGLHPRIVRCNWEGLCAASKPCLVNVRLTMLVHHAILVLGTGPDGIRVFDPLAGEATMGSEEFVRRWTGDAIVVER